MNNGNAKRSREGGRKGGRQYGLTDQARLSILRSTPEYKRWLEDWKQIEGSYSTPAMRGFERVKRSVY